MIVLVNGMVRSGSTWSYNVAMELLRGEPVHGGFSTEPAAFLAAAPETAKHVVLKCHHLDSTARVLARTGAARVVFTLRDPFDAVASGMRTFDAPFKQALDNVMLGLRAFAFHRQTGNALVIPYPEIANKPERAVSRVARYLSVKAGIERAIRATSFAAMSENAARISRKKTRDLVAAGDGLYYDGATLLHRGHIGDGSTGYGKAALTARQVQAVERRVAASGLAPALRALGFTL